MSAVLAALAGLGTWDLLQKRHSILRAYPILGHARWIAERIRPEIYQYFVESNTDGAPVRPGDPRRGVPAGQGHQGR